MSLDNNAAFLDGPRQRLRVGAASVGKPGAGEILVKNHAVGINPIDHIMQDLGLFIQQWPAILGHDIAGEVVEVGEGVTGFEPGTRVTAHALGLITGKPEQWAFQTYTVIQAHAAAPIPQSLSYEDAAVIPLAFSTAVGGLYQDGFLGVHLPQNSHEKTGQTLLVWSGSSSVGSAVIQLAAASGVDVIATASPRNFEHCKSLGASAIFDHADDDIVEKLATRLQSSNVIGAFDAFGTEESTRKVAEILSRIGGGLIATAGQPPAELPKDVTAKQMLAALVPGTDVGKALWKDFLPAALASGQYQPAPRANVIGEGLDSIQTGIDRLKQGVSASKIVVKL
ncbi:uncharacterized protein Z520_08070 [Fonsecaea multimorphosa CBS 102226]|uniref:Enoyl reductase (ER) domain-containing protein n=1 Tax=Fonsecaea multimorphosa CBS 102226 TaxID=1442371 RepID=A0A0D2JS60_9EURO|nr:uncharacterized protein Z520_08070 [Fonsecaea multimorphosa CBS 102226]KIX96292.1 hypothetical protein Z520_08070 [Fonsecaea multimorphosa CBS 102226]OAL21953.1 hypothetical protein AYO22_07550 [Fonsecaea multimorphosa]